MVKKVSADTLFFLKISNKNIITKTQIRKINQVGSFYVKFSLEDTYLKMRQQLK